MISLGPRELNGLLAIERDDRHGRNQLHKVLTLRAGTCYLEMFLWTQNALTFHTFTPSVPSMVQYITQYSMFRGFWNPISNMTLSSKECNGMKTARSKPKTGMRYVVREN